MGTFSPIHWLIVALTVAPLLALLMVPTWRILERAGYSGAWALLMFVPFVGFALLWVLAFVKWPNDTQGKTRTSVPWIVAGIVMLPLSIGAAVVMASADVRRVATAEQLPQSKSPPQGVDWEKGVMTPPPSKP
ncbi:hypothetical protein KW843_22675 [Acidovorax sp. sif1233]|uniref:hypothetical protein n=1 Tax=Acidovorax sp. sif1233 TaxID=2854792 RepID=UPI001C45A789|nr:hypothetical protein [Acidovorax sp. sif1233]MBV7457303.1 hypothetical protein [Acidovorax sp. sif1233]